MLSELIGHLRSRALRAKVDGEAARPDPLDDATVAVYPKDLQGHYTMVKRWSETALRVAGEEAVRGQVASSPQKRWPMPFA